ncbi:MAG: NUDIX domain-containing protein [Anaerolineaceae bacterium]|nr:NUDIX domain-containing protein [Anaerolineaceae bacterium]
MEEFDLYDRNRLPSGKKIARGKNPPDGLYHVVVHVCIFNSAGEMLIQKRSPLKKAWSGLWDFSLGGAVQAGETSAQAAQRELSEELGLSLDFSNLRPKFTFNFPTGFDDVYVLFLNPDLEKLHLQADEVTEVKWTTKEAIHRMVDAGEFINYHHSVIDFLFEIKDEQGMFKNGMRP